MDAATSKRPTPSSAIDDHVPSAKRLKTLPEEPAQYSDAVRKKLASTSRTGQACDRCKERKMKCDTDPMACQPCRQKALRCYTTDRVTGQARERGESHRAENELMFLREQLAAYQRRYGSLQRTEPNGIAPPATSTSSMSQFTSYSASPTPSRPDAKYIGWPSPDYCEPLYSGPVKGTVVDILDGNIDIADWECEMMNDYPNEIKDKFNLSRTSIVNTIYGYQRVGDPKLPPKEEALRDANHFLVIMSQYVPIVHRPSFMELVNRFYEQPSTLKVAERIQVVIVFTIIAHQTAVRNHLHSAEKFEDSHRYFHYALGFYRELLHDRSLASMQAMALIIIHFRNLPKPGVSWNYCHEVLVRAIELEYHRDPDKVQLPEGENDPLSKELRKRVFHSILGVCVTTGCRVGLPAPWQFQHIDIPLPRAIKDSEISKDGFASELSGQCEFWPCLHLAKLLPLLTELHNNIIAVRKPATEYLQTVEALNTKIIAWRQDWDESTKNEPKHVNLRVATLLFETWAAEYQLNLHHPVCCTSDDPEVKERHLDICHKSAKRLLQSFHLLSSRYKGVDFTWHSTLAYATGFGITLYVYKRKGPVTVEQFEVMRNELKGWTSLMAYADLVLRTGNHLQRQFQPRVQALEDECRKLLIEQPPTTKNAQSPLSPVNLLNAGGPLKIEQPNTLPFQENTSPNATMHRNSLPQLVFMPSQGIPQSQPPSPLTHPQPQRHWDGSYPFLPHPLPSGQGSGQGSTVTSPIFAAFPQTPISGLSTSVSIPTIPTSLASLLNDSGSLYMSYPTPPQNQNNLGGAAAGAGGDPQMNFSPNHYFDGPGPLGWPLISMPPGQQS
ncbi:uncharacterized protein Z519_10931 [Cladophialophora bantiana CBS 173.52]|uniref:Zn(2)-C6 fungal-type domain-containing protein n=1 Tax=Cladophialophora bantiana (strain ATCC 10958 / CBS 173.52 / CDC B-1940 / NIH 8579) TaxID=1442370 RepID=A0A0D2FNV4_CLAB1|nr:uncharacterized protein Z519_10931 [Cladophialophora bantiana CBS 173.52]KIW88362.1 hypothetical protein Z519_10931 [Cladophialophora bantiana CBS 173.52]